MKYDRNFIRMLNASALRIYATENITTDLEVVLLERLRDLQDADAHLDTARAVIEDLEDEIVFLKAKIEALRDELNALNDE